MLLAVSVALAGAELAARIWLRGFASDGQSQLYASLPQQVQRSMATGESPFKYLPHNYLGYVPAPGYVRGKNRHNDLGFRGGPIRIPKPQAEFRIVCLGGSTTYTSFVEEHSLSYPSLLEEGLRERGYESVRVINAGAEGYTSWESLINLQFRVLDLEPDMIIIYHAINDVFSRIVWPPWAYRGDNSGSLVDSGSFYLSASKQPSTLLRILRVRFGQPSPSALQSTHVQFTPTAFGWPLIIQTQAGSYPEGIFETVGADEMLRKNQPVYFERNLRNMVAIAQRWNIQPMLATFAYSDPVRGPPLDSPTITAGVREMNRLVMRLGEELEVPVFDFEGIFPADPQLYEGAVHVTEMGAHLKAKMFADFLDTSGLLPGPR